MFITREHLVVVLAMALVLVLAWLGWRLARALRDTLRQTSALRRGRNLPLSNLTPGSHVGLRGHAAAIDQLESPASGREAVYLRLTEEIWDATPDMIGAAGKWVCASHREEAAPFELTDGTDSILVDPEGAILLAPASRGVDRERGRRYVEALIAPQDEVVVLGQVTEQGGFAPAGGYRGAPFRRVIARGSRGLLVATPRLLRRHLLLRLSLLTVGVLVAALLVGALIMLLAR